MLDYCGAQCGIRSGICDGGSPTHECQTQSISSVFNLRHSNVKRFYVRPNGIDQSLPSCKNSFRQPTSAFRPLRHGTYCRIILLYGESLKNTGWISTYRGGKLKNTTNIDRTLLIFLKKHLRPKTFSSSLKGNSHRRFKMNFIRHHHHHVTE